MPPETKADGIGAPPRDRAASPDRPRRPAGGRRQV